MDEINGTLIFNIDVMLAKRKMSVTQLAEKVGITLANMSILKTGKAKAIKVSTLIAICNALDCQPGDILEYRKVRKRRNSGPVLCRQIWCRRTGLLLLFPSLNIHI